MILDALYAEHDIDAIRQKTKISLEDLEFLLKEDFSKLSKPKALGFITILAREYHMNLSSLKEKAQLYYNNQYEEEEQPIIFSPLEQDKPRSKWFTVIVIFALGLVSWYSFTQFEKKTLSKLLPFEEKVPSIDRPISSDDSGLKIGREVEVLPLAKKTKVIVETKTLATPVVQRTLVSGKSFSLTPVGKLWFGLIDISSGKKDQFDISNKLSFDMAGKSWLIATNSKAFSLVQGQQTETYSEGSRHYFKINAEAGIEILTQNEYVRLGGYEKW